MTPRKISQILGDMVTAPEGAGQLPRAQLPKLVSQSLYEVETLFPQSDNWDLLNPRRKPSGPPDTRTAQERLAEIISKAFDGKKRAVLSIVPKAEGDEEYIPKHDRNREAVVSHLVPLFMELREHPDIQRGTTTWEVLSTVMNELSQNNVVAKGKLYARPGDPEYLDLMIEHVQAVTNIGRY